MMPLTFVVVLAVKGLTLVIFSVDPVTALPLLVPPLPEVVLDPQPATEAMITPIARREKAPLNFIKSALLEFGNGSVINFGDELGSGLECHDVAGGNLQRLAGLRVAAQTRFAVFFLPGAESNKMNLFTFFESGFNLFDHFFGDPQDHVFRHLGFLSDPEKVKRF